MFPVIEITLLVLLFIALIILIIWYKKQMKKDYIKATNELVEEGKITKEQADAIIWILFEYKPRKRKRK